MLCTKRALVIMAATVFLATGKVGLVAQGGSQSSSPQDQKGWARYFAQERWQGSIWFNGSYVGNSGLQERLTPGGGGRADFFLSSFFWQPIDVGLSAGAHYHGGQGGFAGEHVTLVPVQALLRFHYLRWGRPHRPFSLYATLGQGLSWVQSSIGSSSASYTASLYTGFRWRWHDSFSWNTEVGVYYMADPTLVTPMLFQTGLTYHWSAGQRANSTEADD
jgi:hypothetical protein